MENWMEREIAQWVHPMKDRSDDWSHQERALLPRSYISLPSIEERKNKVNTLHFTVVKAHSDSEGWNPLPPLYGLLFSISSKGVFLYASSQRQDNTYHCLCYTSSGALAGTRNNSMGPTFTQFSSCHITQNGRLLCCQTLPGYLYIVYYKSKLDVLLRKIGLLLPTDVTEITEATRSTRLSVCVMDGIGWSTHPHGQLFRGEITVLFNDALNTFYLRLYGVGHMVKDHYDSEKGNSLPPNRLLFPINSKGSFICIRQDNTYHGFCYTSRGALAGTRNR